MKETRIFYVPEGVNGTYGELPSEEASHAVRVLRMKEGDALTVTDGRGMFYHAVITLASQNIVSLKLRKSGKMRSYGMEVFI